MPGDKGGPPTSTNLNRYCKQSHPWLMHSVYQEAISYISYIIPANADVNVARSRVVF